LKIDNDLLAYTIKKKIGSNYSIPLKRFLFLVKNKIKCEELLYMRGFFFLFSKIINRNNNIDDEGKCKMKNNKSK